MSPKVDEAYLEARRQQIIDAAEICIAKSGVHGTSLGDIQSQSGLSRGAVYHYFATKDEIIEALRERSRAEDEELIDAVEEADSPIRQILALLRLGYNRNLGETRSIDTRVALFLWAESLLSERILKSQKDLFAPWKEQFSPLVASAQEDSKISERLQPAAVLDAIAAVSIGMTVMAAWFPERDLSEISEVFDALFTGEFVRQPASDR